MKVLFFIMVMSFLSLSFSQPSQSNVELRHGSIAVSSLMDEGLLIIECSGQVSIWSELLVSSESTVSNVFRNVTDDSDFFMMWRFSEYTVSALSRGYLREIKDRNFLTLTVQGAERDGQTGISSVLMFQFAGYSEALKEHCGLGSANTISDAGEQLIVAGDVFALHLDWIRFPCDSVFRPTSDPRVCYRVEFSEPSTTKMMVDMVPTVYDRDISWVTVWQEREDVGGNTELIRGFSYRGQNYFIYLYLEPGDFVGNTLVVIGNMR